MTKEPLSVLLARIQAAFLASGLGEPSILFTLSDPPVPGAFSTIVRLLKKYPDDRGCEPVPRYSSNPASHVILADPDRLSRLDLSAIER